jgi:hypothetical protein
MRLLRAAPITMIKLISQVSYKMIIPFREGIEIKSSMNNGIIEPRKCFRHGTVDEHKSERKGQSGSQRLDFTVN